MGVLAPGSPRGCMKKANPLQISLPPTNLFLPSTFEECHFGSGGTWLHQDGSWKRNDYVGVDSSLPLSKCQTWIPDDVDFSLQKEDHRPLFAKLEWEYCVEVKQGHVPTFKLRECDIVAEKLCNVAKHLNHCFELDVHTHAWSIQTQIVACSPSGRRKRRQHRPLKQTISATTWDLIKQKQQWRSSLADNQKVQLRTKLATFFAAWRFSRCGEMPSAMLAGFDPTAS